MAPSAPMPLQQRAQLKRPSAPSLLAKGFRPFFLLAALHALVAVPIWILVRAGVATPTPYLDAMSWHAHEMVFGYAVAVIAGFLLTAAGNWTGRETARGPLLAGLGLLWLSGRVLLTLPWRVPNAIVAAVDLAFLPALLVVLARAIVAGKSRRNYGILVVVAALGAANLMTHFTALGLDATGGLALRGARIGVDLVLVLIVVIGGRVIPTFTRNATRIESIRSIPWLDRAAIGGAASFAVLDAVSPGGPWLAAAALLAAIASAGRAAFWGARHSLRDPLLWVLHAGYAWVPIGFALRFAGELAPSLPGGAATHAFTAGAIGTLTVGMMARVSLGHTGRMLAAPASASAAFVAISLAALVRVVAAFFGGRGYDHGLYLATGLWCAAFALFLIGCAPMLVAPRVDGRDG